MGNAVRYQDGQMSDPNNFVKPETRDQQAGTTVFDASRQGKMRVTTDGRVESLAPRSVNTADRPVTGNPLDQARTQWGTPVSRDAIGPDTLVIHENVESRVGDLLALGIVVKTPNGYEMAPAKGSNAEREQAQRQQQQQQQQQEDPPKPGDIVRLSTAEEQTFGAVVKSVGAPTVLAMAETMLTGGDVTRFDGEAASALHIEPETFAQHREQITRSFEQAADKALAKVGVSDGAAFREWASSQMKGDLIEAVTAMLDTGDVRPLQALGRKFASARPQSAGDATGDLSPADLAYVKEQLPYPTVANGPGDLLVWIDNEWVSLADLRRSGVVRISRG